MQDGQSRLLLVDDHELIRQGLSRAFERAPDFRLVGEAGSVAEALEMIETLNPDVIVTDLGLPDESGLELVRRTRAAHPMTGIVVLTMHGDDAHLFAALEAGASAFVAKDAPSKDVVVAARQALAAPRSFSSVNLTAALLRRRDQDGPRLSHRETEVLRLLADGCGIAEVARRLFVSESTAKSHVSSIYDKLGATNRAQAIMLAVRSGVLAQD